MLTKLRPSWTGQILGTVALSSALALGVGATAASAQPRVAARVTSSTQHCPLRVIQGHACHR